MSFTVIWKPSAERELTSLWLASRLRHAMRDAADEIDRELARDPMNYGESRGSNRRIAVEKPFVVEFEVREGDRTVYVNTIRIY